MSEREQEREEYETKINELKHLLSRKSTQQVEHNDTAVQKVVFYLIIFIKTNKSIEKLEKLKKLKFIEEIDKKVF